MRNKSQWFEKAEMVKYNSKVLNVTTKLCVPCCSAKQHVLESVITSFVFIFILS